MGFLLSHVPLPHSKVFLQVEVEAFLRPASLMLMLKCCATQRLANDLKIRMPGTVMPVQLPVYAWCFLQTVTLPV